LKDNDTVGEETVDQEIYDVVVLGGGAGGVPAAIRASQLGAKVAIVEARELGGQCMNLGCIPFGHMMVASNILKNMSLGKDMGISVGDITINYHALIKRQDELIAFMRQGVRNTLKKNSVKVIEGRGSIAGKGALDVEGKGISCKKIILATGAQWQKPDFPGAKLEEVVNTDSLITNKKLPQRVLLFGGSPWLLEIAQFLTRFGTQVILCTPLKRVLSRESKTIATRLRKVLNDEGIEIKTQTIIEKVTKKEDGLTVELSAKEGLKEVVVDRIVTLERTAALKGIGLKTIGLDEESSFLAVNEKTETSAEGIYAIGDLTAPPEQHYSHRAAEMGIVAAENAMGKGTSLNPKTLSRVLFTHPEVASIGLTPKEARENGYEVIVGAAPLSMNPLGMILGEYEGIVEVVADKSYGEILGVHLIGTAVSEMIGEALIAIQTEATVDTLACTPFPHPTLSESVAEAARDALGKPIHLP
jgi:dihydrolipoamide dehydrogenase